MTTIAEREAREHYACAIPTQMIGHCRRPATVHFVTRAGECIAHVCAQHARGAGAARMLLPYSWTYDHRETYPKHAPRH